MILRPRQKAFVKCCVNALDEHGNTLGVAPTGAGKTIMLSGVVGEILKNGADKVCVLAHRDELTEQNNEKFLRVNPDISTSVYDSKTKSWDGSVIFAMVQTLCREASVEKMPPLDLIVVDEAHHAAADSYQRIIKQAYNTNSNLKLFGVTATPNRGDKKALRPIFSNVGDQISIAELIASGHLVRPRTFVIDIEGTQEKLQSVRKTVIFCSTVDHAAKIQETFIANGIETAFVHGKLNSTDRKKELDSFTKGTATAIVNVAVLTEGWDYPPASCIKRLKLVSRDIATMANYQKKWQPTIFKAIYG